MDQRVLELLLQGDNQDPRVCVPVANETPLKFVQRANCQDRMGQLRIDAAQPVDRVHAFGLTYGLPSQ
eukprot:10542364-Heterocapsa_arctica.AAC.1